MNNSGSNNFTLNVVGNNIEIKDVKSILSSPDGKFTIDELLSENEQLKEALRWAIGQIEKRDLVLKLVGLL